MAHHRHQNSNNSEWPRIASGQPGSIASKIYSRAHKASRRHYQREGGREDYSNNSPRLVYERNKSRSIDSDMRSEQRKKSKRRESENTWTSQITDRLSPDHRDANHHHHQSHSPAHFEPHHHPVFSVFTNKYEGGVFQQFSKWICVLSWRLKCYAILASILDFYKLPV